jgi:hypothetical protein
MLRTGSALPVVSPAGGGGGSSESGTLVRRRSSSLVAQDAADDVEVVTRKTSEEENKDDEDARARREADATSLAYLWSLLLATLAECLNTCFLSHWYILSWNVNATATMINFIGPFMDGMAFGYEELQKARADTTLAPCLQFRAAFLGYGDFPLRSH